MAGVAQSFVVVPVRFVSSFPQEFVASMASQQGSAFHQRETAVMEMAHLVRVKLAPNDAAKMASILSSSGCGF